MRRLLAVLTVVSTLVPSSGAIAAIVLNGQQYPDWKRAELRAACQGLESRARESLTALDNSDEESGDPASDFRLSMATFTLSDCKAAGLIGS